MEYTSSNDVCDVSSHVISVTPTESYTLSRQPSFTSSMIVEIEQHSHFEAEAEVEAEMVTEQNNGFNFNLIERDTSYTCEYPFMIKNNEPDNDEPVSPVRKTRGYFRTCSSNSLHILLNEVVLPVYCADHMKILPPPTTIYMKTVTGDFVQKKVFMNKQGERYIFGDDLARIYLQDIKGLYRYNST